MESFHISSSSFNQNCQKSYDFNSGTLSDIPCPDENFTQAEGSPLEDDIELPLPPGTSGDDFLMPLSPKQQFLPNSNNIFPFLPPNKASISPTSNLNHVLVPENLNILALQDDSQLRSDFKAEEFQEEVPDKPSEFLDDSKYSPSKVDSDEENQDFVTIKPKVLGKEQAKKRLMAFSLSKQPSVSIKKQSKTVTSAKNKEKPPNPNKGSNVQEQFRATISAIEEEKKKMFQNMPSYLLLEMSELAKSSHTSLSSSLQLLEKLKNENADSKSKSYNKNGNTSNEKSKSKKSFRKSRSRSRSGSKSKNKKRRRSRSRSRSKRSRSRNRKRNHSRSRRSKSRNRRLKEEHSLKMDKNLRENQSVSTKKLIENWNNFKSAGLVLESESELSKNRFDDSKVRRYECSIRSRSPNMRPEFKPIYSYLSKSNRPMISLQAKPADHGNSFPVAFSEKTIKYTRAKPTICWAENPSHATEYYMSKQMLLENCDESAYTILLPIIENKKICSLEKEESVEERITKNRSWYPHECYFLSDLFKTYKDLEFESHILKKSVDLDNKVGEESLGKATENKKEINSNDDEKRLGRASSERKISLVNDSYLSDEEDQVKEMIVGNIKVQLDLDMNSVKVRSKWDSDYEGESSEKELNSNKEKKMRTKPKTEDSSSESKEKVIDVFDVNSSQPKRQDSTEKKKSSLSLSSLNLPYAESPSLDVSDGTTGNLVSEYEEFLKMVSVESSDHQDFQKQEISESKTKTDVQKVKKLEKLSEENQEVQTPKFAMTEWDQESDHEEKLNSKKMRISEPNDEFLILGKNEKLDVKLERDKRKPPKKKNEKFKSMKKKLLKNFSKEKKKKSEETCSEESTSESYESDSDSDSDENVPQKKKKKKKKISKTRKKNRKDSSSDSSSDSDDSKKKKKKAKNKKNGRKKSSSSDDSDGGAQNTLLKQLDFKKQLIMKKIEQIDSISVKTTKKKEKDNRGKKKEKESSEEMDSEKNKKSEKKKTAGKIDKKKFKVVNKKTKILEKNKKLKKNKSSSESDGESSEKDAKKKKMKRKRKQDSSNSSDSEEKPMKLKSKSSNKSLKKNLKIKKGSSSSSSDDSVDTFKGKNKVKKKGNKVKNGDEKSNKITESSLKENLLLDEPNIKSEEPSEWENKKLWKKSDGKTKKEDDNWETSSSVEASEQENKPRESSWDEEAEIHEAKAQVSEDSLAKVDKRKDTTIIGKEFSENNSTNTSETNHQLASETLKTSFSNFSFNENSFCSFGQELSRDFFLAERCYSNSGNIISDENLGTTLIEARPFQSVSKDSEIKKPADSELYSPGYSDSELSDTEIYKSEKLNSNCTVENGTRKDVYDPLNCDSEGSIENKEIELSSIPLPSVSDILLPGESKHFENIGVIASSISEGSALKNVPHSETTISISKLSSVTSPVKSSFTSVDFTPVTTSRFSLNDEKITPTKRQLMSVKGQQKLISKAASVFQDESDEENFQPLNKAELVENIQSDISQRLKEKIPDEKESKKVEKERCTVESSESSRKSSRDRSRERSSDREKRRRSRSRERRSNSKFIDKKAASPNRRKKSKTPEVSREKREIRSDSFEIEPLKSSIDSNELTPVVQPIPVLTGVEASSTEALWNRSLVSGCEFPHGSDNLIDHAESFDIYPPEESKYRNRNYDRDYEDYERTSAEKPRDGRSKKERRKSRSRSHSPKKKIRSKSPERRKSSRSRSPRQKSLSPKNSYSNKSQFSPKRRSPKRKSPTRRYKSSRSPDHKRSTSRSPRKRRGSPSRLSRSLSPNKYWSPKHRDESPRRRDSPLKSFSPGDRFSPKKNLQYFQPYASGLQNRIPVIGTSSEGIDMELSPSAVHSSFDNHLSFHRQMPDSSITEPDMYNSFYESQYTDEFGVSGYLEEVGVNNLITLKSHEIEKGNSTERLTLDQRIELELRTSMTGSQDQSDQYQMQSQVCSSFQEINSTPFQNSYNCENTSLSNDNFYENQNLQINSDYSEQYFNGHQQQPSPSYGSFQQYSNSQPVQNSMLQVGNIVEVVPALQHPPLLPSKAPQIMQVGNVLQVVPSQKATSSITPTSHNYGLPDISSIVKTQKATAVVAPSSIVPTPNPEAVLNPLIKAIQLEREKRKREKEKRKAEREARRKARQLRREAKLMSVNEKLKKSVQNEGLMLGQEVEDDELLDGLDVPSPPIPVEIITFSSPSALPPAGKGILITAGFMPKPPSEKKEVKFADGICPGEGTSTSGGEDVASPPPKPKLPKEKRFKKKKTKVKKKVKVQIIRQIIQEEDDDEDDLSPPPPPPGDPPPVFFARYPFGGDAQFPVYQTQTTTTTLTTVQYPAQSFE